MAKGKPFQKKKPKESEGLPPVDKEGINFSKNPMSKFRGNKTAMKRPSGRKR